MKDKICSIQNELTHTNLLDAQTLFLTKLIAYCFTLRLGNVKEKTSAHFSICLKAKERFRTR